jgi:hypothetical protein
MAHCDGDHSGSGQGHCHLQQTSEDASSGVISDPRHSRRTGTEQFAPGQRLDCDGHDEDQAAGDEADDIARMTVAG